MTTTNTLPTLYAVLVKEIHPNGQPMVSLLAGPSTDAGPTFVCYLSPFEAMLDMARKDDLVRGYRTIRLDSIRPEELTGAFPNGVSLKIICGFCARDMRLLEGARDHFLMCYALQYPMRLAFQEDKMCIDFPEDVLREIDHLQEGAGLFAWQETAQRIYAEWKEPEISRALKSAVNQAERVRGLHAGDMNQIALFDPDARIWHFVPHIPAWALKCM